MQSSELRKRPAQINEPPLCASCAIRSTSLCGALSSVEIAQLNEISHRKVLAAGQLYTLGQDQTRDFANVVRGVAKLVRGSEDGRNQIVGLLFPSDFIGGTLKADDAGEPYVIEAVSEVELCLFPRKRFTQLLDVFPSLERKLLERTLDELQVAQDWMVLLGRKTAQERVATFLLHAADKMANHGCQPSAQFDLPLGRADIADHIGLTIETVSRQITKLRKDGIIAMQGARTITALDRETLVDRAGF
ncbi:MAG: helix-turn-helix domain-containing protein [Pseudomonadota bacterium]